MKVIRELCVGEVDEGSKNFNRTWSAVVAGTLTSFDGWVARLRCINSLTLRGYGQSLLWQCLHWDKASGNRTNKILNFEECNHCPVLNVFIFTQNRKPHNFHISTYLTTIFLSRHFHLDDFGPRRFRSRHFWPLPYLLCILLLLFVWIWKYYFFYSLSTFIVMPRLTFRFSCNHLNSNICLFSPAQVDEGDKRILREWS